LDNSDSRILLCLDGAPGPEIPECALIDDGVVVVCGGDERIGAAAARNLGLAMSSAEMVLVLDSTDRLHHRAIERLRGSLQDNSSDASFGMVIDADGLIRSHLPFEPERLERLDYLAVAALWRRSALTRLGGWREDLAEERSAPWDLWKRLGASGGSVSMVQRPVITQSSRLTSFIEVDDEISEQFAESEFFAG
jgi:glycosyltransferase involved in cell wall biosynthesis